jgi:phosphoribosylanthranilate isomerase
VGVVGAIEPAAVAALGAAAELDAVQLHGDPDAADVAAVRRHWTGLVWAVVRVRGAELPAHAADLFDAADAVVLDARVDGALGGTGVALPWAALAEHLAPLRGRAPLVLAGGLRPENVADAVAELAPDVVDVSSGVETAPGVKDHARMAAFARAARAAAAAAR